MKKINFETILTCTAMLLLALTITIMLTDGIPKPLLIGLFAIVAVFTVMTALTLRNLDRISKIDRSQNVLDIIFSTFELHAHKLPDGEEFEIGDYLSESERASRKNKVDSFEIHL